MNANKSPKLTAAQISEVLGDNLYLITHEGINFRGDLLWADWMESRQAEKVIVDDCDIFSGIYYIFDSRGKMFLGTAKKRSSTPVNIQKITIECLTEICLRKDEIIRQQAAMLERMEKKLFLALNRIHPLQRKSK
jgi:hypothetical protein